MEAVLSIVFHLFVAVLDIYSLVWLRMIGGLKWTSVFYLTIWSIVLQSITAIIFSLSEVSHLLESRGNKKLKKAALGNVATNNFSLYKFVLFHLSFVTTVCVGIMYWSIYAIDPNALTPRDFIYPLVLNNMHHTLPWILSLIQMFIFVKREINSFSLKIDVAKANEIGMVTLFIVSVLYAVAAATKKLITGKFPYPFLNDLNRIQYAVFNMFSIAFGLMMSNISTQILFKVARTMKKQAAVDKSN